MVNIYKVKELFEEVGHAIDRFMFEVDCDEKLANELSDLRDQSFQSAMKIVRDFADEEIALENCKVILGQFNELALEYANAYL